MDDVEIIFESWLEKQEWPSNKTKGLFKRASAKPAWKKFYFVVKKHNDNDQSILHWYEKEEQRNGSQSRGYFELSPKIFKIYKKPEDKGKFIFELSNDLLMCRLAADAETLMDLWVIQLQMLVKLNPRIAGKLFTVKGAHTKSMSRIGGKSQNLLLHVSKWGVTVALERTAAVLAQWPLTTIRNYESTDNNEFAFESGRKSPMGEGKYSFITKEGEDNVIFDTIDDYTQQRIDAKRQQRQTEAGISASLGRSRDSLEEEEINKTYDMLRFSIQGVPTAVDHDLRDTAPAVCSSEPRNIDGSTASTTYSHLGRSNSLSQNNSSSGDSSLERSGDFLSFPGRSASLGSYSHLDPISSWNSYRSTAPLLRPDSYDHLSMYSEASSYDRLSSSRSLSKSGNFSLQARGKELSPEHQRRPPYEQAVGATALLESDELEPDYPNRPLPQVPAIPSRLLNQLNQNGPATLSRPTNSQLSEDRPSTPSRPPMPLPPSLPPEEDPEQDYMSMTNKASFVFLNNAFSGSVDNINPNIIQNPTYSPTKFKKRARSQENINRLKPNGVMLRRSRSEEDMLDEAKMRANAVSLGSKPYQSEHGSNSTIDSLTSAPDKEPKGIPYRNSNERMRSIFRFKKKHSKVKDKTKNSSKKKQKGKSDVDEEGIMYAEISTQASSEGTYSLPYEKVKGTTKKPIEEFEMVSRDIGSLSPDMRELHLPREEAGFLVVDTHYAQIDSKA